MSVYPKQKLTQRTLLELNFCPVSKIQTCFYESKELGTDSAHDESPSETESIRMRSVRCQIYILVQAFISQETLIILRIPILPRLKLKEHMKYCVDHPEEINKLAKLKAHVTEVKGVMMENIEKVLDRGEKIELLVDKTDNPG